MPHLWYIGSRGAVEVTPSSPLPTSAGTVTNLLGDDFGSGISQDRWEVTGNPSATASVLEITQGTALVSRDSFEVPCLLEVIACMDARGSSDNFRMEFWKSDTDRAGWAATGTTATNYDATLVADGLPDHQTGINIGAANNSFRLMSVYIGYGEVVWASRAINSQLVRSDVYRIREHGIPFGPFKVRLAGVAGTNKLKIHRLQAYQLQDIVPPAALGHNTESLAIPVRLTNGPFVASPSNTGLPVLTMSAADAFTSLGAGSVGTGSSRYGYMEQAHVQAYYSGDQPFTAWLECQVDGTNWQVIWYGTATDATADGATRYFIVSPIFQCHGGRNYRVKVKNNGASAGNFRCVIGFTSL